MSQRYLTYKENDSEGRTCFYVLQKAFPHFSGLIVTVPVEGAIINVPISGHILYITFNYTLRGKMIPDYRVIQKEISEVFFDMAKWYYENIISKNPQRYKNFKIVKNDSTAIQ